MSNYFVSCIAVLELQFPVSKLQNRAARYTRAATQIPETKVAFDQIFESLTDQRQ